MAEKKYLDESGLSALWAKTKEYIDNKLSSQSSSSAPTITMETHDSPASGDAYTVDIADNQVIIVTCVDIKNNVRNFIVSSSQLDGNNELPTASEPNDSFEIGAGDGIWTVVAITTGLQSITIIDIH